MIKFSLESKTKAIEWRLSIEGVKD